MGFVVGGIGVAGLAVGAVTGLIAIGKNSDSKQACPNDGACASRDAVDAADSARQFGTISTIAFIAGGVGAALGTVLVLTAPSSSSERASARPGRQRKHARRARRAQLRRAVRRHVRPGGVLMVRRPLRYVLAAAFALTGCSALLDVKDIYFDPSCERRPTSTAAPTAIPTTDGGESDGGTDSATCVADTMTDVKNCGRCGHSCLGGACTAGVCQAVELGSITDAPMRNVVVSDQHVFASTSINLTTQVGGIWRLSKTGGAPELYSSIRYSEAMAVFGDKLYFVVDDNPANGTDQFGGFYSCPLTGPAPCTPTLITATTNSRSITVDKNRVLYGDDLAGKGLMAYTPPGPPTVFRDGFGFSGNSVVDGDIAFYTATIFASPQRAKVFEIFADGGVLERYAYENPNADDGQLIGDTNSLYFTAYDFSGTTGGVVRRIPRSGGAPCDFGGSGNKRPYGIYVDGTRIYWSNQGDGPDEPYTNGSIASCEQAGCCATPQVMWTGNGQPSGVAGDADAIYFVTKGKGSIWRIAKP